MKTDVTIIDPDCREAARCYIDALIAAGLPLKWQPAVSEKDVLHIEWGVSDPDAEAGWEDDEQDGPQQEDDGLGRLVEHYMPNVHLLASDADLAREWLSSRKSRKRRPK